MRKRVGTKVYDTDKAELVCWTPDGDLYRKNNGSFFMWNVVEDGCLPYDLSYDEAKEYTDFLGFDILGFESEREPETNIKKKHCSIRVTEAELLLISDIADKKGISSRAFVMLCVEEYLKNHEK